VAAAAPAAMGAGAVMNRGPLIHSVDDARRLARRRVPRMVFDFVDGAAGDESLSMLNRHALRRIRLLPRVLADVEARDLRTPLLGMTMDLPFGFAPMGMCNLAWPGADMMLARAARRRGVPLCTATAASTSLEEMHRHSGGRAWFQLYAGLAEEFTMELVRRARDAGYRVLVLTADVPVLARRRRDERSGFKVPFRMGLKQLADFAARPRWSLAVAAAGVARPMNYATSESGRDFVRAESRAADMRFLRRLRDRWPGKLLVKGVMSADDALRIRDAGADGVYVSNHGGRQLNSAPPAIQALPGIRRAVGGGYPLVFDSGIRSGEDVVKALACGADYVMVGRPLLFAIGAAAEKGLVRIVDILAEEVSLTLALTGLRRVADISANILAPEANHG